jgi:predicted transcriptional regulator
MSFISIGTHELNQSLFHDTTVGQIVFNHKECISIACDEKVDRALEVMAMRGISSLPVQNKSGQFIGILNMADIVAHMCGYVRGAGDDPTIRDDGQKHRHHSGKVKGREALTSPVQELLGLTWESRHLVIFDANDRLDMIFNRLSSGNHRALVQGKGWWQVISQWDLACWLAIHSRELDDPNLRSDKRQWLGSIVHAPIGSLGLCPPKHVLTLNCEETAMDGFRKLAANGVSAMPVVTAHNQLCGTLSTSDLKGMSADKLKALELPVQEFLKVANTLQFPQVACNSSKSLGDLLLQIQARDVHRVWVMGTNNNVAGVVSLSDILQMFSHYLSGKKEAFQGGKEGQSTSAKFSGMEKPDIETAGTKKACGCTLPCNCGQQLSEGGPTDKACGCKEPCDCGTQSTKLKQQGFKAGQKECPGGFMGQESGGVKKGMTGSGIQGMSSSGKVCSCIGPCTCSARNE